MRDDTARLEDILDSIALIEKSLLKRKIYELTELEFQGVLRCLEIIGEACRAVSEELKAQYIEIPWREIADMRNVIIHQYFEVDAEKIDVVLEKNLPELKTKILGILGK